MAIDFTNRNPQDPNGIASIKPSTNTAWIKTDPSGAWQGNLVVNDASPGAGYRSVGYATVILNDGRTYKAILDGNGQPISEVGDTTGYDPDQQRVWQQSGPKQQPPGASPTQRRQAPDGQTHIYGYNPQTGQYDQDQGAVATGTKPPIPVGGSSETQGTPDSSKPGGWDNTRPRQVIKDKDGNIVWSEELTGADLTAWRANQQANQSQTGEKREAVPNRPGWTAVTRATAQGGNKSEVTTYIGPDGKEVPTLPAEPPKDTPTTKVVNGVTYVQHTTTKSDGTPGEIYWTDQQGNRVSLPTEPRGVLPTASPPPSGRLGEAAADLAAEQERINAELRKPNPTITPEQGDKLMEARRQFWQTALSEQQGVTGAQQTAYGQQVTQRSSTLSDQANRRTSATGIANQAASDWMPLATKLGAHANGEALLAGIDYQRQSAQNFVNSTGANRVVPEIQLGPAVQTVNAMPLPYGTAAMPNLQRPVLGLGAVPSSITPGLSGATVEAANQATMAGTQQAITPLLRPAAPVAATPSAPQPAVVAPAPASAMPPGRPDQTQAASQIDNAIMPPAAPSVSPVIGDPGYPPMKQDIPDPSMPVNVPYPSEAGAESLIQPSPYFLAGSSRGHVYDPTPSVQALIDDPTIHNDAVRQAVAELYPGYPIDRLLGVA